MHGNVEQGAKFLGGPAVIGLGGLAQDGGGEGAVTGEVDITEGEQAAAIKAGGIAVSTLGCV